MGYTVSGPKLLHNGREIQLHGVNVCGAELNDATISGLWSGQSIAEMITRMKAQGFNAVRIPIGPRCIQNVKVDEGLTGASWYPGSAFLKGKRSLEIMDFWIAEFEKQGVRYFFDWHYLENGKIPDLWYTGAYSEQQWLTDLKFLAQRYKGRPGFVGIDIKNEPNSNSCTWGDGSNRDWRLASEKAFQAINSVNQDVIIIVELLGVQTGLTQFMNNRPNIPADRIAYSPHVYFSDVWGQYVKYFDDPNYPSNLAGVWDQFFGKYYNDVCIIVGEWGGKFGKGKPKDKTDQETFVAYLKARGIINHTYWQWGDNSGDTGGVLADGTWKNVRGDKVQMLYTIKTSKATYLDEAGSPIPEPPPVVVIPPRPIDPVVTPTPVNPGPATPVNVTFPSSMRIDNFPSVQKVSLDRDVTVQMPSSIGINNLPLVQKVEVTNPTEVQMPNQMAISNFPQVQQVQVLNPANVALPSSMAINNFPATQRVIVENPGESSIPENLNVTLSGQAPQINNFNLPDTLKVLLQGGSTAGDGSTTTFPDTLTLKQALTLAFPTTLPQLTINLRPVEPTPVVEPIKPRAFAVGTLVSMLASPTIKMCVAGYKGDLTLCSFGNDMTGSFDTVGFPEAILRAWTGA